MKKIFDFIIRQIVLVIVMFGALGILYMLYTFSNNIQNSKVFYKEINVDDYHIIIDLNTGMIDKNEILKVDVNDLSTKQSIFEINSIWQVLLISSIIMTIAIDIILGVFIIFNKIIFFFVMFKCRKILKDKYNMSDECLYELPQYEPIIANAIYKKRYQYLMMQSRFEYYYREKGILDRNNRFKENLDFDTNSLSEIERIIMKKYQRSKEEIKRMTEIEKEAENQRNRKEVENKIDEILRKKGYYKDDIVKIKVKKFFEIIKRLKENKEEALKSDEVFGNFLIFLVFGFIIGISKVAMCAAIILGIWLLIRGSGVPLNEAGEIERAKIIFLINHLKNKKELTEEEKHFLIILTQY